MANRRMFSKDVVATDRFQNMSFEAQALYMQLSLVADDDGFVGAPKRVCRGAGAKETALSELTENGYLMFFPSGVCVVSHWKVNNYIQKDRYKETVYIEEKKQLSVGESGVYFIAKEPCIHSVSKLDTQVRLESGKGSIGEESGCEVAAEEKEPLSLGEHKNVFLTKEELKKLKERFSDYKARIESLSRKIAIHGYQYKNHYAVLVEWAEQDRAKQKTKLPAGSGLHANAPPAKKSRYDYEKIERKSMENVAKSAKEKREQTWCLLP